MTKPFMYITKSGKAIRSEILEQYAIKGKSKQIPSDQFGSSYTQGLIRPLYNPEALARVLEMNTYHYRACKTKARDIAGLGWFINPLVDNPNQEQYNKLEIFFDELEETVSRIFDKIMMDFESIGYGAAEITRLNYDFNQYPVNLVHMPAHTIRIHKDGNRFVQIRGNRRRWFKRIGFEMDVHCDTGEIKELGILSPEHRATEILWFVNYTPRSDYYGLPDTVPVLGAIHGDLARRDYNIAFFDNFGVPAYAVFVTGNFDPGPIDEKGRSEFEKDIEEHFNELSKNPHSTLIMSVPTIEGQGEVKIEFKPLSTDVKEASFRLFRQDNKDEVLAAHGVPPYRMGIAEAGSLGGNIAKEATEVYKRSVIEPRQEMLEAAINKYIFWDGFEAYDWEFKFAEIDTKDEKHDLEMATKMFDKAAMTPNQLIRYFGRKFGVEPFDHPAMDAYYLDGRPVTIEMDLVPEMQYMLQNLQRNLLGVAERYASAKDGSTNSEFADVLASIKACADATAKSRGPID